MQFGSPDTPLRIASYINNVHPVRSREIYEVLQTLLHHMLPLINKTLSISATPSRFWAPRVDVERSGEDDLPNREPGAYQPQWKRTRATYLRSHRDPYERPLTLHNDFRDTGCQMILDISRISLTPESPTRPSTDWHVQGQLVRHRLSLPTLYKNLTEQSNAERTHLRHFPVLLFVL